MDPGLGAGEGPGPLQEADPRPGLGQDPKGEVDAGVEGARGDQGLSVKRSYQPMISKNLDSALRI